MKSFKKLYNAADLKNATVRMRNSLIIYISVALCYAGLAALFIWLYRGLEVSIFICFPIVFIASIVFVWFSVLFFSVSFADICADRRFYRSLESADIRSERGEFLGESGELTDARIKYIRLVFTTAEGQKSFYVKGAGKAEFVAGKIYDLRVAGSKITAYGEVEQNA